MEYQFNRSVRSARSDRICRRVILHAFLSVLVVGTGQILMAQDSVSDIQARLSDIEARQADTQMQIHAVDEQLKPENIQMALAGVGTTQPEVLREQRRRQLETQKKSLVAQLDAPSASKARLDASLLRAQQASYVQSANPGSDVSAGGPNGDGSASSGTSTPRKHRRSTKHHKKTTHTSTTPVTQ
jgi:hypothetical protein